MVEGGDVLVDPYERFLRGILRIFGVVEQAAAIIVDLVLIAAVQLPEGFRVSGLYSANQHFLVVSLHKDPDVREEKE